MKLPLLPVTNWLVIVALWCVFLWLVYRSPALRWAVKVALLVGWGLMTVGVVLWVIFALYLPRDEYGAAAGALLAGSIMCLLWLVAGLPELWTTLKTAKRGLKLWEER